MRSPLIGAFVLTIAAQASAQTPAPQPPPTYECDPANLGRAAQQDPRHGEGPSRRQARMETAP